MVAAGKTATLECRVMNIGDRTVSEMTFPKYRLDEMLFICKPSKIVRCYYDEKYLHFQ